MDTNRQRKGRLDGPLVIVAVGEAILLLMRKREARDLDADAVMYELDQERLLEEVKPLAIWLKFLYGVELIDPPIPVTDDELRFQVRKYQAVQRALQAADRSQGETS